MISNDNELMPATVRIQLDTALAEVSAAEKALEEVLLDLRAGIRAEKVTITAALENAFIRLRGSRAALAKLKHVGVLPSTPL